MTDPFHCSCPHPHEALQRCFALVPTARPGERIIIGRKGTVDFPPVGIRERRLRYGQDLPLFAAHMPPVEPGEVTGDTCEEWSRLVIASLPIGQRVAHSYGVARVGGMFAQSCDRCPEYVARAREIDRPPLWGGGGARQTDRHTGATPTARKSPASRRHVLPFGRSPTRRTVRSSRPGVRP